MRSGLVNATTGKEVAVFFMHGGQQIGLHGEGYKKLVKLSERIQKVKELNQHVSMSFLKNSILEWIEDAYGRKTTRI